MDAGVVIVPVFIATRNMDAWPTWAQIGFCVLLLGVIVWLFSIPVWDRIKRRGGR